MTLKRLQAPWRTYRAEILRYYPIFSGFQKNEASEEKPSRFNSEKSKHRLLIFPQKTMPIRIVNSGAIFPQTCQTSPPGNMTADFSIKTINRKNDKFKTDYKLLGKFRAGLSLQLSAENSGRKAH